jgi:hypothetical protein
VKKLKQFLFGYGRHLFWGLLIILGGLLVYLTAALAVGYRPYSSRPGVNWHPEWVLPDGATLIFLFRFLALLGVYVLAALTLNFILFRLLRLIAYNRIVFALMGGLAIGLSTFYITLGIGWYIAVNELTVLVAGGLGLIYGATLFPIIINQNKYPQPPASA